MSGKYKCPSCGYENVQHGPAPESLRCGYCGDDVFIDARMAEVDKMLRAVGAQRRAESDYERVMRVVWDDRFCFDSFLEGIHGSFAQKIAEAFLLADAENIERLSAAWPGIGKAWSER